MGPGALPGPTPRLKPLNDDWLVADRWSLSAAGAVARTDPEEEDGPNAMKALRVSELFEVRENQQKRLGSAEGRHSYDKEVVLTNLKLKRHFVLKNTVCCTARRNMFVRTKMFSLESVFSTCTCDASDSAGWRRPYAW